MPTGPYTTDTPSDRDGPVFGDCDRLLFPADTGYWRRRDTLGSLRLTWYHNIDPEEPWPLSTTSTPRPRQGGGVLRHLHP